MKILITTDTVGGVWNYSMTMANGLLEDGVDVLLLAMGPFPSSGQLAEVSSCPGITFFHLEGKLEWMDDPWDDVKVAGEWIHGIYSEHRPDLIHFNHFAHVTMVWECPVILVAHSCVASWWETVKKEPLPGRFAIYYQKVKEALHAADWVISPSLSMLHLYRYLYGQFDNASVIHNGSSFIAEITEEKTPIIFSMGRIWDEAKNLKLLIKAAPNIKANIFIAGEKSEDYETPENVAFLGKLDREEVSYWLEKSSIYVLPVKYEPFGLSFLEAALHHCALVGGDIPTLREIWQEDMIYAPTDNEVLLAQKCNELLENKTFRAEMSEKAFSRANLYSLEKMKKEYYKIYSSLLGRKELISQL